MKKAQKDSYQKAMLFIIAILITGHLVGTTTHILHLVDVMKTGFHNWAQVNKVPLALCAYWLTLAMIDPIIAFVLVWRPKIGAALAFANILINVTVNTGFQIASLPTITLQSMYDALGDVCSSLQIAFLMFSLFTLPIILRRGSRYVVFFSKIPLLAFLIGLIIHLVGLSKLVSHMESFWTLWVHTSMTVINSALVYLLLKKLRLGYFLGIALLGAFGSLQACFAGAFFIGIECSFNLTMAMTISVCCLAIAGLILDGENLSLRILQPR